jgi:hypothetical protein
MVPKCKVDELKILSIKIYQLMSPTIVVLNFWDEVENVVCELWLLKSSPIAVI